MKFLVLILSFFINLTYAQNFESELDLKSNTNEFKTGDIVEATLRIWPLDHLQEEDKTKLLESNLLGVFKVISKPNIHPSENNADILEIDLQLLAIEASEKIKKEIVINGQTIQVAMKNFKITQIKTQDKAYYYADQSVLKFNYWAIILVLILGSLVLFLIYNKKLKKKKVNFDSEDVLKKLLENAKERSDFEKIYQKKHELFKIEKMDKKSIEYFLEILNKHQYKKTWNQNELQEVQESFNKLKGGFNVQ